MALQFRLKPGVEQRYEGEDLLLADQGGRALRLTSPAQPLVNEPPPFSRTVFRELLLH